MARVVGIGHQDFGQLIQSNYFYIDKTEFIRQWWENGDAVTLITRPKRFGRTLNMSMLEYFFSVKYADKRSLFDGLAIWQEESCRQLQGTYPVISLSFANVKGVSFSKARKCSMQPSRRIPIWSGRSWRGLPESVKSPSFRIWIIWKWWRLLQINIRMPSGLRRKKFFRVERVRNGR